MLTRILAIKSKAGVRTPFAGVITAIIVLLAIYALTAVFFYIPNAALSAVIIHAVGDLITAPDTLYKFWRVSPLEVVIFFIGVIVTVFSTIENGIYSTICVSAAMLLYRILRTKGRFLGRVKVHSVVDEQVVGESSSPALGEYGTFVGGQDEPALRNVFIPIGHGDGSNPEIAVEHPYPGIFIYRFAEGFTFPNASHTLEFLTQTIFKSTRRTNLSHYERPGDRPWNDPGPTRRQRKEAVAAGLDPAAAGVDLDLPPLKAVILDFSTVNNVDVTSVQNLIDVRNQLDRYTSPEVVNWHFANVNSRWTKRALASAGFGLLTPRADGAPRRWKSLFSVADIGGSSSAAAAAEQEDREKELASVRRGSRADGGDIEAVASEGSSEDADVKAKTLESHVRSRHTRVAIHGINRPLFHIDLTSALQSAITNAQENSDGAIEVEAAQLDPK